MAKKSKTFSTPQSVLDLIEQQSAKIQQLEKANEELNGTLSRTHEELQAAKSTPSPIYLVMRENIWIWDAFETEVKAISALESYAKTIGTKLVRAYPELYRYQMHDKDGWCWGSFYIKPIHIRTT